MGYLWDACPCKVRGGAIVYGGVLICILYRIYAVDFRSRSLRQNFIDHSVREFKTSFQKGLRVSFYPSDRDIMWPSFRRPSFFLNTKDKMDIFFPLNLF